MGATRAVLASWTTAEAELVRGALENEGIPAWVEPAPLYSFGQPSELRARVHVRVEDLERAREIARSWAQRRA